MALNYIWAAFFLIAAAVALCKLVFMGDVTAFTDIIQATIDCSRTGFDISIGLTGVLCLWMGIMRIGEQGGAVAVLARWLSPLLRRLFPEVPDGHPVMGNIFMNLSANMLGLDNAATPIGLKAMAGLQELNPHKETASNAMIMFMVLNTGGLTLVPVSIMAYRASLGAADPTDVFLPILLTTLTSAMVGVCITGLVQRINLLCRPVLVAVLVLAAIVGCTAWAAATLDQERMGTISNGVAGILLLGIIIAFMVAGMRKGINVYDAFIDGAKGGFQTAIGIVPYLVAILVGIGVLRASGAMDWLLDGIGWVVEACGGSRDIVGALPTAFMKPLSGSGARGMMLECMTTYGPDSIAGRLSCVFQGSTDTTFYILAVYFGSVGIRHTRNALALGLLADLASIVAAIVMCSIFFS